MLKLCIEAKDTLYNGTPLHFACKRNQREVVQFFLSKGANKNANDKDGQIPYNLSIIKIDKFTLRHRQ